MGGAPNPGGRDPGVGPARPRGTHLGPLSAAGDVPEGPGPCVPNCRLGPSRLTNFFFAVKL